MTSPAAPAPDRGSWRRLALGLGAFVIGPMPMSPMRALFPIEQTLVLFVAAVAACGIVAWKNGGSLSLAVAWLAMATLMLASPIGPPDSAYGWLAKGWTLLIAASFGLVSIIIGGGAFFPRALSALAVATSLAFALVLVSPGGPTRVGNAMASELNRRNEQVIAQFRPRWDEMVRESPSLAPVVEQNEAVIAAIPRWATLVMPALLALESLAALALGWALFHRMSRVAIGPPLGRLRDFRFNDHLVWGVAVGASVFLLQAFAEGKNAGLNLLVFFGFLYVLRGMGILAWMSRRRVLIWMFVALAIFAFPLAAALAFGLGLGDTWLDLRARAQANPSP